VVRQDVLYMAAMSASNWNLVRKAFHNRLKAAGKLHKVVIVAVMRKMITMLDAMVRDDIVWVHHSAVPATKSQLLIQSPRRRGRGERAGT
jgi:transposase